MDWMLDGYFYSEWDKVQIATRTFDDEVFEWWDELKAQRHFYGERPINTWHELKAVMRKQFRQNSYEEFLLQDHDNSDRDLRLGRIDQGLVELREGMDKIESLFSQWKESSLNLNKVCNNNAETPKKEDSLKTEHEETHKVEESLEVIEDEDLESMNHNHDSLIEEEEVYHVSLSEDQHHSEFQQLNQVGIWKEDVGTKERATHLKRVMKRRRPEGINSTTEREFFQGRRKKIRNEKRVRKKKVCS